MMELVDLWHPGVCNFTLYLFSGNVDNLHTTNNTVTRIGSGYADAWSSLDGKEE